MTLSYSKNALNVLKRFHRSDFVAYVEGEDDRIFWEHFYGYLNIPVEPHFKVAGGGEEIEKYLHQIRNEDAQIIVIRDRDYSVFFPDPTSHVREIYSLGHSIENTVYAVRNISKCISVLSGSGIDTSQDVIEWFNTIEESIKNLQVLEIASFMRHEEDGVKILGDNPFNVTDVKPNQHLISADRAVAAYNSLVGNFREEEIRRAAIIYSKSKGNKYKRIRGHFLTGLVGTYICHSIDCATSSSHKTRIHVGATYKILVGFIDHTTIDSDELRYIKRKMKASIKSLGIAI